MTTKYLIKYRGDGEAFRVLSYQNKIFTFAEEYIPTAIGLPLAKPECQSAAVVHIRVCPEEEHSTTDSRIRDYLFYNMNICQRWWNQGIGKGYTYYPTSNLIWSPTSDVYLTHKSTGTPVWIETPRQLVDYMLSIAPLNDWRVQ